MDPLFRLRTGWRNAFNLNLLYQRDCDGYLVTGKHSGTHWLKHMLTLAMAEHYRLPRPAFADGPSADIVIAHPRHGRRYPGVPRIVSSHAIPPYAFDVLFAREVLSFPKYVVLVRDIRPVLISAFEKWKDVYGIEFSEFVRGDRGGKRFACDVWWCMHFFNRWGDVLERAPGKLLLVRYEELIARPEQTLDRVVQYFGMSIPKQALAIAVHDSAKDAMARRHDPGQPVRSVRFGGSRGARYSSEDAAWLKECLRQHLRHDLGYDYGRGWEGVTLGDGASEVFGSALSTPITGSGGGMDRGSSAG